MAYSITTNDDITIDNIPDNIKPDDQSLKDRVAKIRADRAKSSEPAKKPETTASGVAGAITRGVAPIAAGAALGAAAGSVVGGVGAVPGALAGASAAGFATAIGDPVIALVNHTFGTKYTLPTDAMNHLLTNLGVPNPETETERVLQAVAGGVAGAGSGVAAGTLIKGAAKGLAPTTATRIGAAMAENPAAQLAGGAAAGAASQTAAESGLGPVEQVAAGLAGGIAGGSAGNVARRAIAPTVAETTKTQALKASAAEAEKLGIPVMTSDVLPPSTTAGNISRNAAEKVPLIGTAESRIKQQSARVDAAKNLIDEYGAGTSSNASSDVLNTFMQNRGKTVQFYSDKKQNALRLSTEVDNPSTTLNSSNYVPVERTQAAIDKEITSLKDLKLPELNPVIKKLEGWKDAVKNQTPVDLDKIRAQMGESFKGSNNAEIQSIGEKSLKNIYTPIKTDIEDYVKVVNPEGYKTLKLANEKLSQLAVDLENASTKSVIRGGTLNPDAINRMLFSNKTKDIDVLYRNLSTVRSKTSDVGIKQAQTAIIQRAVERSGGIDNINPDKFVTELNKLPAYSKFFTGADLDRVEGLKRAIDLTRHAGEAAKKYGTTGERVGTGIGGASVLTYLTGGIKSLAAPVGVAGAGRVYESPAVRNILVKLAGAEKGSKAESNLYRHLVSVIASNQNIFKPNDKKSQ